MAIDWGVIRRKGEEGLLTADVTDALCELAEYADKYAFIDVDEGDFCWDRSAIDRHADDCPLVVLEAASVADDDAD